MYFFLCQLAVIGVLGIMVWLKKNKTVVSCRRKTLCCPLRTIIDPLSPGVLLGILGEGVPPVSLNTDPVSGQKCNFPHPFSDLKELTKSNIYQ